MKENDIDKLLKESFDAEDRALFEKYSHDMGIFEMLGESFRGRNRWLTVYAFVMTLVFFGLTIWCGFRFFDADVDTTKEIVGWGIGFTVGMLITGLIKIWFWLDMQRNATTREIKRLELTIANLKREDS